MIMGSEYTGDVTAEGFDCPKDCEWRSTFVMITCVELKSQIQVSLPVAERSRNDDRLTWVC